jgi:hypothetical protein
VKTKKKYIVSSITQTCTACPSQWEGHFDDGNMFYCRYRHGILRIKCSVVPTSDVMEAMETLLLQKEFDELDSGIMTTEELLEIMKESGKFGFNQLATKEAS